MAVILIEGFEAFVPGSSFTPDNFVDLLMCLQPDINSTAWFSDTGDSCKMVATDSRIAGYRSLEMVRSSTTGGAWADVYGANIGWGFLNKQKLTMGVGLKYDKRPNSAIPVLQFRMDDGTGEQEQLSVWISPDGKVFCSSVDYVASVVSQLSPVVIPEAATPAGTFRFTKWQYLEVFLDYSGATPAISVQLNGQEVLVAAVTTALQKLGQPYVSSAHVINPPNTYFTGGFTQHVDDIYITGDQDGFLGPQQVMRLPIDGTVQSGWTGGGTINTGDIDPTNISGGVTAGAINEVNEYSITDLPAVVGKISAVGINMYGYAGFLNGVELHDTVEYGFKEPGTVSVEFTKATLEGNGRVFRFVTENLPGSLQLNKAGVDATNVYIKELGLL